MSPESWVVVEADVVTTMEGSIEVLLLPNLSAAAAEPQTASGHQGLSARAEEGVMDAGADPVVSKNTNEFKTGARTTMEPDQKPAATEFPPLMPRVPTIIMMKDTQPTSLRPTGTATR